MIRLMSIPAALILGLLAAAPAAVSPAAAKPGGCLKYGAAGAVAGHAAGHGIKGALAGCAVGMYERHRYNKQMREQGAAPAPAAPPTGSPPAKSM
jgi:hypothetical protein